MEQSDKKRNVAHLINLLLEEPKIAEVVKAGLKKEARNYIDTSDISVFYLTK